MNRFKNASNNKYFKYIINELKAKYDELILSDTDITDEMFDIFYRTGSRLEYENVYFRKRTLLTASAALEWRLYMSFPMSLRRLKKGFWELWTHTLAVLEMTAFVRRDSDTGNTVSDISRRLPSCIRSGTVPIFLAAIR